MSTNVFLIDDHTLVRSGVRALLEKAGDVTVVGEAATGKEAIEACERLRPHVVLADVEMRDLNGIETTRRIRATYPDTHVIMLSMYADRQYVFESLRAGALGYVLKDAAVAELLTAIRSVACGKRYLSPALSDLVMEDYVRRANGQTSPSALDKLSAREREILQLVAEGYSSAEVAARLAISVRTVDTHRFKVMQKLDIHSIAGLTRFAIASGLTSIR
jgi:DNA-binding NarL/FixJ family response regulator